MREIRTRKGEYQAMAMGKEFIPEREHRNSGNFSDGQTPSRPSSLELNQQFMAQQGYPGQNYTGQIPNQGRPGPGHPQGQYAHTNGPVGPGNVPNNYAAHQQQMNQQQQYQYNHNHNVDYATQARHYDAQNMAGRHGSPAHSPSKQRMTSSRSTDKISSPRPSQPPPAPPGMQRDSPLGGPGSASRDSLPPPPPPPPNDTGGHPMARGTPPYGSPAQPLHIMNHHPGVRDSPIRTQSHSPSPQHHTSSTPDSIDLPPPPPPPPIGQTPDTPGSMPPPPPTPPPDMYHAHQGHTAPGTPAPPPPPLPPSGGGPGGRMPNGNIPGGHLAAHHQPMLPH